MFEAIKDSLASRAAKSLLSGRIERYGRLTDLRIRSREHTISADILLTGETDEIHIQIDRYIVTRTEGNYSLEIESLTASRAWLQLILEDFLVDNPIRIPSLAVLALGSSEE